jgi:hypothetical protein
MENKNKTMDDGKLPRAETGNASNPSPRNSNTEPAGNNQLFSKKAEGYLREAGNIEDMPDARQQEDADNRIHEKSSE